jgi:hypothetical protein
VGPASKNLKEVQNMPEEEVIKRAQQDKAQGKSPSTQAGAFVREEMHHIRVSKTSCSISGATSTTIVRITLWKGKRRIRPPHDQSQISPRFGGNLTVEACIRPPWRFDFFKGSGSLRYPVNLCKNLECS